MSIKSRLLSTLGSLAPDEIKAQARADMNMCAELGLVEIDAGRIRFTETGRRALSALETLRIMTE